MCSTEDDHLLARALSHVGTSVAGKYRIDGVLGVGGVAAVFAVTHRNKRRFAIKMLHPELSLRADLRARFLRDGYAANRIDHPGTVAVLDDDIAEDGAAFLVTELFEGETVEARWERSGRRLPLQAVLSIGHGLLDVLAAAHARGIVHGDVKPATLLLAREGGLKVLDFGIAGVRDAAASYVMQVRARMGAPAFSAPEQALGHPDEVDGQTDVWAAGATLFMLASGRMVHEAPTLQGAILKAATQPAPSLASVLAAVPGPLVHIVDRALAFEKGRRWPTAAAMRDALWEASVACFGRLPSLPPVGSQDAMAPTLPSVLQVAFSDGPAAPRAALVTAPPPPLATVYVDAPSRPQTAPVSRDRSRTLPRLRRRRRTMVAVVACAGSALMGVVLTAMIVTPSRQEAHVPPTAASRAAVTATVGVADTPTSADPIARPDAVPTAACKPDCNPTFYLNPGGGKRFKPECFRTHGGGNP